MNYGFGPVNSQTSFLSDDFELPENQKEAFDLITKRESLTASCLNLKEIGQYETVEVLTGQTWFTSNLSRSVYGQSQPARYSYRRVFDVVALNEGPITAGSTTVRISPLISGITIPTKGFGSATLAGPSYVFFPSADITFEVGNSDPTKQTLTITNNIGSDLIQCYITIEYLKQP